MSAFKTGDTLGRAHKKVLVSALVLLRLLSFGLLLMLPTLAEAQYATGGNGLYKNEIIWFSWGTAGAAVTNTTRTNTYSVGGQTLIVTCSISNLSGTLNAYRPGNFQGDGFDDMYNIGGTGTANTLVVGLNSATGSNPSFTFSCSATLDGSNYPLDGLVMADAEQMDGTNEYIQAVISSAGTWRVIDRYRAAGCTFSSSALQTNTTATRTLRLSGSSPCRNTAGAEVAGPTAVAFMENVATATVSLQGSGISAIALGVIVDSFDRGDAPATYGEASHQLVTNWTGGTLTAGTITSVNNTTFTPGTLVPPPVRFGALADGEPTVQNSAGATADDLNNTDDEDALPAGSPGTVTATAGSTYTLSSVACNGGSAVRGWIDWNRDGDFLDTGEISTNTPTCSTSPVSLSWTVPNVGSQTGTSFLRLRTATAAAQIASPTGSATTGEVEDHPLTLNVTGPTTVTGTIFGDTNRNGAQDTGETAFTAATVTVTLTNTTTGATLTTTTATGSYTFNNVSAGTYNISATASGYSVTTAARTVTVTSGTSSTVQAIGLAQPPAPVPCSVTFAGGQATTNAIYPLNADGTAGATLFTATFAGATPNRTSAFARDPVTNRLYYIESIAGTTAAQVGYYDFTTGQKVDTGLSITKTAGDAGNFTRFGFNASGVGYASISATNAVYRITTSPFSATRIGTISGLPTNLSGDFAITAANRAWLSAAGEVYRVNLNDPSLPAVSIVNTNNPDANGVAFTPEGNLLIGDATTSRVVSAGTLEFGPLRTMTGRASDSLDFANCVIPTLEPNLTIIKTVSPSGPVSPGTELTYTITVNNTGNAVSVNTTFQDNIPANTTYVAGSTTKNGVATPDAAGGVMPFVTAATITSPDTQFGPGIVGTGTANQATVSFKVRVNNPFPSGATAVTNQGFVEYDSGTSDTRIVQPTTPPGGGTGGTPITIGNRDFGDAPDAATGTGVGDYQTTGSDDGPSHTIVPGLRLGSVVPDADPGTLQDATATADNTTGTNDEEGVTSFPYISTAPLQVITVPVGVTNTTGSAATLVGYIDFNRNGVFSDPGEQSASVSIAADATSANVVFTTPSGLTAGTTYARFRIGSTASEVTSSVGAASSGEVEDYRVTIGSPDLTIAKTHTPATFVRGSTGTYTLTVANGGNQPTNGTITVTDTLPAGLNVNGGAAGTVSSGNAAWTCNSNAASPQVITCTSSAVIAVSGNSVFTLNVNVASGAGTPVVNTASVSGGGEAAANNGNNTGSDSAVTVAPTDLTLTKSHSGNFTVGSTGTYNFTVNNIGGVASSGTITVTDTLPAGLSFVTGSTTGTGWSCSVSGQTVTCSSSTAIAAAGNSTFSFNVNIGTGTTPGTNSIINTAAVSGGGDSNTANNSANNGNGDPTTVLSPDLTISKTHTGNFVRGSTGTYTVTVGNTGTVSTSGTLTLTDTLPTGLNVNGGAAGTVTPGGTNAANWSCTSNAASPQVITCTSTASIAISGSSTFTLSVNVASGAGTPVVNSASVSGGNEATANSGNNTASDSTVTASPTDLTLTKSHTGNFTVGQTGSYSLTVNNIGGAASSGTITVTDTLPTGLTFISGSTTGTGWSCSASGQTVTCTSSTAVAANGSSAFGFSVNVGVGTAPGTNSITNTAAVSGGGDSNTANNSANNGNGDPTTILSANLTLAKSHTGSFVRGSTGTYALTVSNTGTAATNGTITVTDTLPTGLSVNGGTAGTATSGNAAWTCSSNAASPQVVTCTSSAVIATSGSSVFSLSVNVAPGTGNSVTNSATVSGGGEATANNGDNTATDPTTTVAPTDLTLVKSHSGDFTVSGVGTYSFTVSNSGGVASSGTTTVTDTLPVGLTVNSGGSGAVASGNAAWTCGSNAASPQVVTCTSSTAISGGNTSIFTFTVNVGVATAPGTNSITNTATVSGGGDSNPANNSASDPTTVLSPNLRVTKTHTPSNFVQGGVGSYTVTVRNNNAATTVSTSGTITVTDTLPDGLSVPAGVVTLTAGGTVWNCSASGQVITCTYTSTIAKNGSSAFSFNVNVASSAPASVTNNAAVSGGNEATANVGNNSTTDPTTIVDAGNLTLVKSVRNVTTNSAFSSAGSGEPGDVLEYCVAYSNSGQSPVSNTVVNDTIPLTTTPLTSVLAYSNQAIRWRITQPSTSTQNLSAVSGDDDGELGAVLTVRVGAVPAGGAGDVCFQAQIK